MNVVSEEFQSEEIQVKGEIVYFWEYSESIQTIFGVSPLDQCFYYQGERVFKLQLSDINGAVELVNACRYPSKVVTLRIVEHPKERVYKTVVFESEKKTVKQGLEQIIEAYNIAQDFSVDFSINFQNYSDIENEFLYNLSELQISFSNSKKLEEFNVHYNNCLITYKTVKNIQIRELTQKLELYLRAGNQGFLLQDLDQQVLSSDLQLSKYDKFFQNRTVYCEVREKDLAKKGIYFRFFCENRCENYDEVVLGLGIFDIKEEFMKGDFKECMRCGQILEKKLFYRGCDVHPKGKTKPGRQGLIDIADEKIENLNLSDWFYLTFVVL